MQWDKTCSEIAKETADEHKVLTSQVKEAVEIYLQCAFGQIRKFVPTVIPKLGLFFLSPWKTNEHLLKILKSHRRFRKTGEGMTKEETVAAIEKYWAIHNIARTHRIRTGQSYRIKIAKLKANGDRIQGEGRSTT